MASCFGIFDKVVILEFLLFYDFLLNLLPLFWCYFNLSSIRKLQVWQLSQQVPNLYLLFGYDLVFFEDLKVHTYNLLFLTYLFINIYTGFKNNNTCFTKYVLDYVFVLCNK